MNALDVQSIVTGILTKVASQKAAEEKKEDKKEDKKVEKTMGDACKYAFSLADSLSDAANSFDYNFGSAIDKAVKVAYDSPNALETSKATGVDFKSKNEHLDAMAVGEDPAKPSSPSVSEPTVQHLKTTLDKRPGGKSLSEPPLMNKSASAYEKILAKLAGRAELESPNSLERLEVSDSGAGQQGYDSGKSDGNNLRPLIQGSNEKAVDYTQRDAKREYIKEQMGQVFDEVHPEKDTVVDRFIDRGKNTSKLANLEEAKKMKEMATKEVEEEKKEEKVVPGIHKKIEKEAGLADKAGKFFGKNVAMSPEHLLSIPAATAGAGFGSYTGSKATGVGEDSATAPHILGALAGGSLGALPGGIATGMGYSRIGVPLAALGAGLGAYGGGQIGKGIGHLAGSQTVGDAKAQMLAEAQAQQASQAEKQAEEKCTCEGKGTCECCKNKMCKKLATILVALKDQEKTAGMETAMGDGTAAAPGGMDVAQGVPSGAPEAAGGMPQGQATPEEIEKLKKILLMLQMKRQQEEAAMAQGQGGLPPEAMAGGQAQGMGAAGPQPGAGQGM